MHPYSLPVMDAIWRSFYKTVVWITASQMSKTDSMANTMGHRLQDDPVPILYIAPTREFVVSTWEPRFRDMVRGCAELWKRLRKGKDEKKTLKRIAGVKVRFAWAGSPTEMAGEAACKVYIDERDRMEDDIAGEGDPKVLADARHKTYPDGQTIIFSTPLTGNVEVERDEKSGVEFWAMSENVESATWKLWQKGTRHHWVWPCPHCKQWFVPRMRLLTWPKKCTADEALEKAFLKCPNCEKPIREEHKEWMNAQSMNLSSGGYLAPGERITKDGEIVGHPRPSRTVSFWTSGLCTPDVTFGEHAYNLIEALRSGDPESIQGVINTGFGELYAISSEAIPSTQVAELRLPYKQRQHVPGVRNVTCGVDVQKTGIYYVVRGWGNELESWLLEHGHLQGATDELDVWEDLGRLLDGHWCGMQIQRMFVDSGYRTSDVYRFCRKHFGRAFPAKGWDNMIEPLKKSPIDRDTRGRRLKHGLAVWHCHTDYFKRFIHERFQRDPELPGGWHLSEDTTDEYCLQVTAEARVVKPSGRAVWVRLRNANHYLDCEMLNLSAAYSLNLQVRRAEDTPPKPPSGGTDETPPPLGGDDSRGGFADGGEGGAFGGWFDRE